LQKKDGDFMKISAVIAEFNPFHAGHEVLISKMKENSEGVIAIMSGNFVQRGECSIFEKSVRAADCIKRGVDLVLELPLIYCLSSAEGFAEGSVKTLHSCGVVSELWFGSEHGEIDAFMKAADILNSEPDSFSSALIKKLSDGYSFPAARSFALKCAGGPSTLNEPNNILGTEYVRALKKLSSSIIPKTIRREGTGYNDTEIKDIPSASAIRKLLEEEKSADLYMTVRNEAPLFMKSFDLICAARLKAISKEELCLLPDCNEEIATRLKSACQKNTIEEILSEASCKSYTLSRLRRILINMMINNTFKSLPSPTYIRPLAMNKVGTEILKMIKKSSTLPVISRSAALKDDDIFRLECRGTDIYNLACGKEGGSEFSFVPIIV